MIVERQRLARISLVGEMIAKDYAGWAPIYGRTERSIRIKLVQQRIEASQQKLLDDLRKWIPVSVNQALLATIKSSPK